MADTSIPTALQFRQLVSDVPPAIEWFANIDNPQTRRAYENDLRGFMQLAGIARPIDFRIVTRSHVLAGARVWKRNRSAATNALNNGADIAKVKGVAGARQYCHHPDR